MRRWMMTGLLILSFLSPLTAEDRARTQRSPMAQQTFVVHVVPKIEVQHLPGGRGTGLQVSSSVKLLVRLMQPSTTGNATADHAAESTVAAWTEVSSAATTIITIPDFPLRVEGVSRLPILTIVPQL